MVVLIVLIVLVGIYSAVNAVMVDYIRYSNIALYHRWKAFDTALKSLLFYRRDKEESNTSEVVQIPAEPVAVESPKPAKPVKQKQKRSSQDKKKEKKVVVAEKNPEIAYPDLRNAEDAPARVTSAEVRLRKMIVSGSQRVRFKTKTHHEHFGLNMQYLQHCDVLILCSAGIGTNMRTILDSGVSAERVEYYKNLFHRAELAEYYIAMKLRDLRPVMADATNMECRAVDRLDPFRLEEDDLKTLQASIALLNATIETLIKHSNNLSREKWELCDVVGRHTTAEGRAWATEQMHHCKQSVVSKMA